MLVSRCLIGQRGGGRERTQDSEGGRPDLGLSTDRTIGKARLGIHLLISYIKCGSFRLNRRSFECHRFERNSAAKRAGKS